MSKNVFDKLAQREHENDTKLGMPSTDGSQVEVKNVEAVHVIVLSERVVSA